MNKSQIKNVISFLLVASGANSLFLRTKQKCSIHVINYHEVRPYSDKWRLYKYFITPENFEKQIRYLKKRFKIVDMRDLLAFIQEGFCPFERCALITFDDGTIDFYKYAFPILRMYNVPATVFLTVGPITRNGTFWWHKIAWCLQNSKMKRVTLKLGKAWPLEINLNSKKDTEQKYNELISYFFKLSPMELEEEVKKIVQLLGFEEDNLPRTALSWPEIQEIDSSGLVTWGAHTVNHPNLSAISEDEALEELYSSLKEVKNRTSNALPVFSYPGGFYSTKLQDHIVTSEDVLLAFKTENRSNLLVFSDNSERVLDRTSISSLDSYYTFKVKASGLFGAVLRKNKCIG